MTANVYETLYNNMKNKFTVVSGDSEYTLGEYMLMKAGKKNLPAERTQNTGRNIVSSSFSYIKEKLTVKNPPHKDRTIKRFPLRTTASALLSAVVICSMVLSFGIFSSKNLNSKAPVVVEPETSEINSEKPAK